MMHINKRYIVDERDNPKEVIILLGEPPARRCQGDCWDWTWMMKVSDSCVSPAKIEKAVINTPTSPGEGNVQFYELSPP